VSWRTSERVLLKKIYLLYISPAIDRSARNVGGGLAIA
jgi:hypothetical protein